MEDIALVLEIAVVRDHWVRATSRLDDDEVTTEVLNVDHGGCAASEDKEEATNDHLRTREQGHT